MASQSMWINYEDRMNRVVDYIYENLDEELDLIRLAEVACLSPYHWHRVYSAMKGETIKTTVKRLRLQRAAHQLINTTEPISKIASKSGYSNVQSFTRGFASLYGMPPAAYRKTGSHRQFDPQSPNWSDKMYEVEIREIPSLQLLQLPHRGAYIKIGAVFEKLWGALASQQRAMDGREMIGVYYDDPSSVEEQNLRSCAGVTALAGETPASPLQPLEVRGGTYAVLRHKGPYVDMAAAYQWLYGEWLAKSGREVDDAPAVEAYLNTPMDTPPTELLTEIRMPLKG